jgi:predicted oxidoreductase (fatty acid repression mutant protein)
MGKLKPNRKTVCSQQSIDRIVMIINENWDEIWEIVQERDRNIKAIKRQNLRDLFQKCSNAPIDKYTDVSRSSPVI